MSKPGKSTWIAYLVGKGEEVTAIFYLLKRGTAGDFKSSSDKTVTHKEEGIWDK